MSERPGVRHTARLYLVPGSLELYDAELDSPEDLGALLRAEVPPGWPPGEHDRSSVEFFRTRELEGGAAAAGWYAWYVLWRGEPGQSDTLVGSGGYFGPPRDGVAEIGYSVVESWRGRGIASEVIAALTERALAEPGVTRVIAHTAADNAPSQGALRRAGFRDVEAGDQPGMRRFERVGTTLS